MPDTLYLKATGSLSEKGTMTAVASDESLDRHGETISINGWDYGSYKSNPVLQWAHDYSIPPIGRANGLRIEERNNKKQLVFEPEFHEETELSKQIKTLFEKGYLKAFSVGFIPKDMEDNNIKEAELLEISAVPVPSNPNALVFAKSKGMNEVVKWIEATTKEKPKKKKETPRIDKLEKEVDELKTIINTIIEKGRKQEQKEKIMKKALQKIARNTNWALNKSNKES